jgi:hypothetical protein
MVSFETAIRFGQTLQLMRDLHLYSGPSPSGVRYYIYLLSLLQEHKKIKSF